VVGDADVVNIVRFEPDATLGHNIDGARHVHGRRQKKLADVAVGDVAEAER